MEQVPYTLKNSLIPAILLHSPVFSPLKNSVVRDKVFFRHERTYQESITYMGYQLDSDLDFKLYSFIVSKSHSKKDWAISFSRNELFDALNIKFDRDYKKFQSLFIRIERFKDCKFVLEFCKSGIKNNKSDFSKKRF
ncbi:hypothetical protein KVP08_011755 [Shewanella putrefaciens]|nr:hypothetical protein KVP08_011755 [Shewanella putrefaciens]